jgi:hypothetical protein
VQEYVKEKQARKKRLREEEEARRKEDIVVTDTESEEEDSDAESENSEEPVEAVVETKADDVVDSDDDGDDSDDEREKEIVASAERAVDEEVARAPRKPARPSGRIWPVPSRTDGIKYSEVRAWAGGAMVDRWALLVCHRAACSVVRASVSHTSAVCARVCVSVWAATRGSVAVGGPPCQGSAVPRRHRRPASAVERGGQEEARQGGDAHVVRDD